ncbi:MAG: hypothetical protein GY850_14125, partial [bacterium]|nr:hypothetical protein [bacterium]
MMERLKKHYGISFIFVVLIILLNANTLCAAVVYELERKWGGFGTEEGRFDSPKGIVVDDEDNVFVADFKNHRIQKF